MFQQFPHAFGVFSSEVNRTKVITKTTALRDFLWTERFYKVIIKIVRLLQ